MTLREQMEALVRDFESLSIGDPIPPPAHITATLRAALADPLALLPPMEPDAEAMCARLEADADLIDTDDTNDSDFATDLRAAIALIQRGVAERAKLAGQLENLARANEHSRNAILDMAAELPKLPAWCFQPQLSPHSA